MLKKISEIKGLQKLSKVEQLTFHGGTPCFSNVLEAHCDYCNGDFLGGSCLGTQTTSTCLTFNFGYTNC